MRWSELPNPVTSLTSLAPYHSNEINESNQDKEINKQACHNTCSQSRESGRQNAYLPHKSQLD